MVSPAVVPAAFVQCVIARPRRERAVFTRKRVCWRAYLTRVLGGFLSVQIYREPVAGDWRDDARLAWHLVVQVNTCGDPLCVGCGVRPPTLDESRHAKLAILGDGLTLDLAMPYLPHVRHFVEALPALEQPLSKKREVHHG